ncbi:MAG: pantoate--beta-alanine ligase [Candidatus Omnitrophica bacterium]|nr:pantoate--beta-alanine ligase [Candidatus Omnitrophota bacterium]
MRLISNSKKIVAKLKQYKGKSLGFVPTMGALHEGHLSLIRRARRDSDIVVVSIFVNPKQFGPKEDLQKYPRPLKKDLEFCRKEGVDFVFCPNPKEMYPLGYRTYVDVEGLSNCLCGISRPGHFRGVATIVTKLLNIVQPDTLYLGQKDAQQAVIIKRMIEDLNLPVKVRVMPTVREENGLAISSRNIYLSASEKKEAVALSQALKLARLLIKNGSRDTKRIVSRMRNLIRGEKRAKIDYIEIVDMSTLKPVKRVINNCLIALAVRIGNTRLIDNLIIRDGSY